MSGASRHSLRVPGRASRALLLRALCALLLLGGCRQPEPPAKLPPIPGNLYRANIFGLSIEKPAEWVFLPETCLKEDTDAPIDDLKEVWERLHMSGIVPLVGMAPQADAEKGEAPVVELHSVAMRPGERSLVTEGALVVPPERVLASRSGERARNPGFQVLEEAKPVDLAGQPAAVTRLAYRVVDDQGLEHPVEELMWFFRRGRVFFYLIQTAPAPLSSELVETFERIAHSVRLDS